MQDVAQESTTPKYHLTGPAHGPVVVALGGISASKHVERWWSEVAGEGRVLDTTVLRVLGIDWLDGCRGDNFRPAATVSTHDQAELLARSLDVLNVERIEMLVGASYGGMVGLAFAERHPDRVEQLVIISAPAQPHPMSTALRSIQRRIVELGIDTGRAFEAMVLARALAMTTYRSASEFAERFGPAVLDPSRIGMTDVESYLLHHGEKFARSFTPERFLALSLSVDTHRVQPERITVPAVFVAAQGDTIVPREQMLDLARRWGGACRLEEMPSLVGHDAFLAEPDKVGAIIRNVLQPLTATLS